MVTKMRTKGFTILELMVTLGVFVMLTFLVTEVSALASSSLAKTTTSSSTTSTGRTGFEALMADVRQADMALSSYPTAAPAYAADNNSTLILRIPQIDATGNPVPQTWHVAIYRYVAFPNSDLAPGVLVRYTATINNGVESAVAFDKIAATRCLSVAFTYVNSEQLTGYYNTQLPLIGTPVGDAADFKQAVLVGGVERLATGKAWFQASTLNFDQQLNGGTPVDALYQVDPSLAVNPSNGIAANNVVTHMILQPSWTDRGFQHNTRNIDLLSRAPLLNR